MDSDGWREQRFKSIETRLADIEARVSASAPASDRDAFMHILCGHNGNDDPKLPLARSNADAFFARMRGEGFIRRAIEYDFRKLDPHWGLDNIKIAGFEDRPMWSFNGEARLAVLAVYAPDSEWQIVAGRSLGQPLARGSGSTVLLDYAYLHPHNYWRLEGFESLVVAVARRV